MAPGQHGAAAGGGCARDRIVAGRGKELAGDELAAAYRLAPVPGVAGHVGQPREDRGDSRDAMRESNQRHPT